MGWRIMPSVAHPFDPETLYEMNKDGNIRVSKGKKFGIFTTEGRHITGEIREADPQLCVWVGNNPDVEQLQARDNRFTERHGFREK